MTDHIERIKAALHDMTAAQAGKKPPYELLQSGDVKQLLDDNARLRKALDRVWAITEPGQRVTLDQAIDLLVDCRVAVSDAVRAVEN